MAELLRRPDWYADAACAGMGADTAMFFPDKGESLDPALAFCSACTVIDECREAGDGEHGVWGGTSMRQRQREARKSPILGTSLIRSSGRRPAPSADEAA